MNAQTIVDEWEQRGIDLVFNVGAVGSDHGVYDGHLRRTSTVNDAKDLLPQRKVLWSHFGIPDVPINEVSSGSLTLNTACGGMSPDVIQEASLLMGAPDKPFCVRFPTLDALHYATALAKDDFTFLTQGLCNDRMLFTVESEDQLRPVLDAVRKINGILFTGGLGPAECELVVLGAQKHGITTVLSHPDQRHISLTEDQQAEFVHHGAWVQYTAAMLLDGKEGAYGSPFIQDMVSRMERWPESAFICSDVGRVNSKHVTYPVATPVESMSWYTRVLVDHGLSLSTLERLLLINPQVLLNERRVV